MAKLRRTSIEHAAPKRRPKRPRTEKAKRRTCIKCPAVCCHDLAIPTERPRTKDDIEDMKWHLQYDTVHIAIRNRRWYLVIDGRCIYLDGDDLCTIYDDRPQKCHDHNPPDCERFDRWYNTLISTPEELETYLRPKK